MIECGLSSIEFEAENMNAAVVYLRGLVLYGDEAVLQVAHHFDSGKVYGAYEGDRELDGIQIFEFSAKGEIDTATMYEQYNVEQARANNLREVAELRRKLAIAEAGLI